MKPAPPVIRYRMHSLPYGGSVAVWGRESLKVLLFHTVRMDMDVALVPTHLDAPAEASRRPVIFYLVWAFVVSIPVENQLLIPGIGFVGRLFGVGVAAVWGLHALATGRVRKLERFHVATLALVTWC